MALEFALNALVSLASLLWVALLLAIPVFLAVGLVGKRLLVFFQKRWNRSWIQSAFLASYAMFFVLLIIAFFAPIWQATQDSDIGLVPQGIALTPLEMAAKFVFGLVRMLLIAAFFSALALPFVFAGEFFRDSLQKRVSNRSVALFGAVWACMALALLIALSAPWILPGLLYLVYWA